MAVALPPSPSTRLVCPYCRAGFQLRPGASGLERCERCGRAFEATHFRPAAERPRVREVATAGPEGATPCANHEGNAAEVACERCGLFLCALCELEASADGKILCPACFDRLRDAGELRSHLNRFPDYAGLAIAIGLGATCVGGIAGPVAIYYAVRGLGHKERMGEAHGRWMLYLGVVLGFAQIAFALLLLIGAIQG